MKGLKGLLVLPKEPDDEGDEKDDDAGSVGKKAAVEDMMDAIKGNDKRLFASALTDFLDLCHPAESEEPEQDEG